ncbi:MAG: hypothetical protein NZ740_02730 [Kiritimatiellae bacterium]|nr:hypothetical protein [Kiritimatiellia bacterium]MDW8458008.1 hypothetical protein [Verrucomicrobiota bacterium]
MRWPREIDQPEIRLGGRRFTGDDFNSRGGPSSTRAFWGQGGTCPSRCGPYVEGAVPPAPVVEGAVPPPPSWIRFPDAVEGVPPTVGLEPDPF